MATWVKGVLQVAFFVGFSWCVNALTEFIGLKIPGSIVGIALLFILLQAKIVKLEWIDLGAKWLIAEMLLFFIPSAVGIVQYGHLVMGSGARLLLVTVFSILIVMIATGLNRGKAGRAEEGILLMMLPAFCFLFTLAVYWGVKRLYRQYPTPILTPLLLTPAIVTAALLWSRIPYSTYQAGAHWIGDMIGPATVALAVPIYKNLHVFKKHAFVIVTSVLVGSTVAILSSAGFAKALHLDLQLIESVAPRSATTPIAMSVSRMMGGIPTVTAILVLATGLLGMLLGPAVIRTFRIRNSVAQGVLFGTGAHSAGTSKAFEFGPVAGSISSIAMILTAFFTVFSIPWVIRWIL